MATLYMTVGLPGSGKSYYAKENFPNAYIASSDKLREELWGDENKQGDNEVLFNTLHRRITGNLLLDNDVVYDATNLNAKRRRKYLKTIEPEHRKVCLFFLTDIDICKERNKLRDRTVPDEVIDKMYRSIQIPQYSDVSFCAFHSHLQIIHCLFFFRQSQIFVIKSFLQNQNTVMTDRTQCVLFLQLVTLPGI